VEFSQEASRLNLEQSLRISFFQKEAVTPEACGVELRYKLQMGLHPWDIFLY
jgi:hypothetical protein